MFSNSNSDGSGTSVIQQTINFNQVGQDGTPLPAGGTAILNSLSADFDLTGLTCNQLPYICVELQKGNSPSPDFVLIGQTVRCVPVECRGRFGKKTQKAAVRFTLNSYTNIKLPCAKFCSVLY